MATKLMNEKALRAALRRALRKKKNVRIDNGKKSYEGRVVAVEPPSFSLRCTHNPGALGARLEKPLEVTFNFSQIHTFRENYYGATATITH